MVYMIKFLFKSLTQIFPLTSRKSRRTENVIVFVLGFFSFLNKNAQTNLSAFQISNQSSHQFFLSHFPSMMSNNDCICCEYGSVFPSSKPLWVWDRVAAALAYCLPIFYNRASILIILIINCPCFLYAGHFQC